MVSSAILLIKGFTVEKRTGTAGTPCHGSHSDPLNKEGGQISVATPRFSHFRELQTIAEWAVLGFCTL